MTLTSLRARLIVIILVPLLLISTVATAWQFHNATQRAQEIFDRGLLSAALAISRDVAVSDGDALSPTTRRLVNNTSGGELFYHVFAPDGVFVTGYATPPIPPRSVSAEQGEPHFYDAQYQRRDVRVLRFEDVTTVSGISGQFTITVWQDADVRNSFVRDVIWRSVAVLTLPIISVALVVWFGVGFGLRPLLDLEAAIAKRTPSDLDPIRRNVPQEAQGIVATLNILLDRISRRISSKDEFIANAAHQLRNPVAGVLALAEAVHNAPHPEAAKKRSAELIDAARKASHLTNQLLSFERAAGDGVTQDAAVFSLNKTIEEVAARFEAQKQDVSIDVQLEIPKDDLWIAGDSVMVQEALLNLMMNSLVHGGPGLTFVRVTLLATDTEAQVRVQDDGAGIPKDKHIHAISRFGQANSGQGSGLGLAIAARVMTNHGGTLRIQDSSAGASILLSFPRMAH